MIEFILVLFLAWAILFIGFYKKDYGITCISGLFIMVLGIFAISIPFEVNNLGIGIGLIHIGLGFYIVIRSSIEILKKV